MLEITSEGYRIEGARRSGVVGRHRFPSRQHSSDTQFPAPCRQAHFLAVEDASEGLLPGAGIARLLDSVPQPAPPKAKGVEAATSVAPSPQAAQTP